MQQVHIDQFRTGQPLPCTVYDRQGRVLLKKGSLIESNELKSELANQPLFVIPNKMPAAVPMQTPLQMCEQLEHDLGDAFSTATSDFLGKMDSIVKRARMLARDHFDISFASLVLSDGNNYPVAHQLHTGILVASLLPKLPMIDPVHHNSCIAAALTMNIGMLTLQAVLLNQRQPLSIEQQTAVRMHPEEGMRVLKSRDVTDSMWLDTVLYHHEKSNGTGYPLGTKEVPVSAELVSLADIFCAKVSTRGYRQAITPGQAARDLLVQQGAITNPGIAAVFIKEVGVYPPGTFVKLSNGEIAMVSGRGQTAVNPKVIAILDQRGRLLPEPLPRDTATRGTSVAGVIPRERLKNLPGATQLLKLLTQS